MLLHPRGTTWACSGNVQVSEAHGGGEESSSKRPSAARSLHDLFSVSTTLQNLAHTPPRATRHPRDSLTALDMADDYAKLNRPLEEHPLKGAVRAQSDNKINKAFQFKVGSATSNTCS